MFYSFKELKQQSVDSLTKEKKMSTSQIVMKCQKKNIQIVLKMKPAETIMMFAPWWLSRVLQHDPLPETRSVALF